MSSTNFNIGLSEATKSSSRVLKPPGGGHSDIFGQSETRANPPRPKYDQQNSSNLNGVMGTVDPNIVHQEQKREAAAKAAGEEAIRRNDIGNQDSSSNGNGNAGGRVRVPPGGFSQGLW